MSHRPLRIACVLEEFPAVSQTFVLNQIVALLDRGQDVQIFPDRLGDLSLAHADFTARNLMARTHVRPKRPKFFLPRWVRPIAANPHHAVLLLRTGQVRHGGEAARGARLIYSILPLLGQGRFDIIHAQFGPNGVKAVDWRRVGATTAKIVTTFHGYDVNVLPAAGEADYTELFQRGDLFTANTQFLAGKLRALGCPAEKLMELPMGADLRKFQPSGSGSAAGVFRIVSVARLNEAKGIQYVLRALAELGPVARPWEYAIVGDGPMRDELERLRDELRLGDRVRFLGAQTQEKVRALYAESSVLVLPSIVDAAGTEEALGLVLVEAQACGLPVIGTRIGGIPEALIDGKTGFLVPQKNSAALAEKMRLLMENPALCATMGAAGRAFVEQKFDADKLADRFLEKLRALCF